ncbi:MAG TPA: FtsX-like permease family protein [Ohtaekwangia sp.]|nr:FtsX-like permease family protein [Ohtaekwangia sp.]
MAIKRSRLVPGNYLKIVARAFYKNRSYTILNLLGLGAGFAVFLFAAVYVYFETHFEDFHTRRDRIYRATYRYSPPGDYQTHWARIPFDYINNLPQDVSGIQALVRFQNHARKYIRIGSEKFKPAHAYVADNDVFKVFDFELVSGNAARALEKPHSIVISESLAHRYFGNQDAMGKEVSVTSDFESTETLYHITAVMKDLPANTHLPVDMLFSFRDAAERTGWAYTYILLDEETPIDKIAAQMPAFIRKYTPEDAAKNDAIIFQALPDIHLESNLARELVPNGKVLYVRVVGFAGLLILIIAVINFMNLNSAMSLGRAKEMGVRKVMGASRAQLIGYLLTESVIHNLLALALGGSFAYLAFPAFQQFVTIRFLPDLWLFGGTMLVIAVISGLAAGVYPVMLLTTLKPVAILKSTKALTVAGKENPFSLRRVMVTLQFGISILLLGSALIAYNQFRFLHEKNLGMQPEQIIAIPGVPDAVKDKFDVFKDRLSNQRGILGVSACMEVPSREIRDAGPVPVEGMNSDPAKAPVMDIQIIEDDFPSLMGLTFVAGRNIRRSATTAFPQFSETFTIQQYLFGQPREYLINETAMNYLGWKSPEQALGQRISWSINDIKLAPGNIVGVVKDFHQESLRNKVDPLVMVQEPVWLRTFLIKVETDNVQATLETIQAAWNDLYPAYPMDYHFLDDLYNELYKGERVQLQLLFIFSALAILIAFIGLVGMVAYALKTRTKELAIRQVLGAKPRDLVRLMSSEYIVVLLIGAVIAVPLSIYVLKLWLSGFAYHVNISAGSYIITLGITLGLLLVTVGLQTFRASKINPAETLRNE